MSHIAAWTFTLTQFRLHPFCQYHFVNFSIIYLCSIFPWTCRMSYLWHSFKTSIFFCGLYFILHQFLLWRMVEKNKMNWTEMIWIGSDWSVLYLWALAILQDLFVCVFGSKEPSASSVQVLQHTQRDKMSKTSENKAMNNTEPHLTRTTLQTFKDLYRSK